MAQKVTLKVSAAAAAHVRADAAKEERLRVARGGVPLSANDLGIVLFILTRDQDPDVRAAAVRSLRELPEGILLTLAASPETHPLVLDVLARIHHANDAVVERLLSHPDVDSRTIDYLAYRGAGAVPGEPAGPLPVPSGDGGETDADKSATGEEAEESTEDEAHLSKYQLLQQMGISEKIRMALIGDKEWRSLLVKDTNKLVSTAVVKNPRITEPEILAIAKASELSEEVIRLVCMNKDWIKLYPVRKALVENSKTPLPRALRFMSTLNEKDIAVLAKSKNVSSVLSRQAQRILLNKKKS